MRSVAVILARAVAFLDMAEINPRGTIFTPDLAREIVARYQFQKFPQTLDEWRGENGAVFEMGKIDSQIISKLVIWTTGITVETHSNTSDSKRLLVEMLAWASERFGLPPFDEMSKRWAFISDLSFYSDAPLLTTAPAVRLADKVSSAISEITGESVKYEPLIVSVGHDPLTRKYGRAPFSIQRRLEVPFKEHKYFSEAPLPTDLHIKLLEEYEADVSK